MNLGVVDKFNNLQVWCTASIAVHWCSQIWCLPIMLSTWCLPAVLSGTCDLRAYAGPWDNEAAKVRCYLENSLEGVQGFSMHLPTCRCQPLSPLRKLNSYCYMMVEAMSPSVSSSGMCKRSS